MCNKNLENDMIVDVDYRHDFFQLLIYLGDNPFPVMKIVSKEFDPLIGKIKINDCLNMSHIYDKGIGSFALKKFIEFCKSHGFNLIIGDIVEPDWKYNIERIIHFYSKQGFKIFLDKENLTGRIELNL